MGLLLLLIALCVFGIVLMKYIGKSAGVLVVVMAVLLGILFVGVEVDGYRYAVKGVGVVERELEILEVMKLILEDQQVSDDVKKFVNKEILKREMRRDNFRRRIEAPNWWNNTARLFRLI